MLEMPCGKLGWCGTQVPNCGDESEVLAYCRLELGGVLCHYVANGGAVMQCSLLGDSVVCIVQYGMVLFLQALNDAT